MANSAVAEKPVEVKTAKRILFYSVPPNYKICIQHGHKVQRQNDKGEIVEVEMTPNRHIEFANQKTMISQEDADTLQGAFYKEFYYGVDFISAYELRDMMNNNKTKSAAQSFINQMWRAAVKCNIVPPNVDNTGFSFSILTELNKLP